MHNLTRNTAVLVDVDGTLCDVSSVRHHVLNRPKNFEAFHQESEHCPAHPEAVAWCIEQHRRGHTLLVVTARSDIWHGVTERWLRKHLPVSYAGPFMRRHGDWRKDTEVKTEAHFYLSQHYEIVAAIDDNPAIIALWESLGIPTTVVPSWDEQDGAYSAKKNPLADNDEVPQT